MSGSGPLSAYYRDPRVSTSVPAELQQHRLLRKRLAQAQPHLRNLHLRKLNSNRVDLDAHERQLHPERFPRVHNLPDSPTQQANLEQNARPFFYRYTIDLFKAAFGVFIAGYDALGVMGDSLVFPTASRGGHGTGYYQDSSVEEPEILIRLSYSMLQFAQNIVGFILKAVFFPYVGSFEV